MGDFSEDFNQEELSDLILHLIVAPSSRKRPRSVDEPVYARSFFVHKIVLYKSPYYKALLQRWKSNANTPEGTSAAASSAARSELVQHVDEGELDAVELLLKCMYKAGLPEEAHGNIRLLLQIYRMADKYEVPAACMEPIIAALSELKAEDLDVLVLKDVYSMPEGHLNAPSLAPLLATCQLRLLELFGDVPSVVNTAGLMQQFCALPHAAVLAWLKTDNLKVHCVLFLLSVCLVPAL